MGKSGKTTLGELMGARGEEFHDKGLELHDLPAL